MQIKVICDAPLGWLNAFYDFLPYAMHHHRETTHYDETEKRACDSPQIVRAKENIKLGHRLISRTRVSLLELCQCINFIFKINFLSIKPRN